MRYVQVSERAKGLLGLLQRKCGGDSNCIEELDRAYLAGLIELRSDRDWVFDVESSVDPAAFDLYEPPLILTFIQQADGSLLVTSVRRA